MPPHLRDAVLDATPEKAEDSLRVQKDFIDGVINAMDDTFFIFESETGKVIQWNTAFKKISGYSDEEIRSLKAPTSYYNEEELKKSIDAIQKIIKSGKATLEMSLITKDGILVPFEYVGVRVKSPEGKAWICAIGRNITKRKKVEKERNKLLDRYEERVKELRCLYKISKLDKSNGLLDEILRETNLLLPPAWHLSRFQFSH